MNSQTLLYVDHATALGGAEQSLLLLLSHLDRTRWEPHLICAPGPVAKEAKALGLPVHALALPRLRGSGRAATSMLGSVRAIMHVSTAIDASLLAANTVRAAFYTAPAASLLRRPYLWHMRDFWLSETRPKRHWPDTLLKWFLVQPAEVVVANSAAVARHLPRSKKVHVIQNGIAVERFQPGMGRELFRRHHGIPPQVPVVGIVGRLRPWKGQDTFLRIAARVAAIMPDVFFAVIGGAPFAVEGAYPRALHRLASDLGIARQTVFTGQLDDVRPALAGLDVFVHAGEPEPFGLVNVEAMAMGLPVVAFDHGALREIVVAGETGVLCAPADEDAMAEAVVRLLQDRENAAAMGRAGRERAEKQFTISRVVAEMDALLAETI